MAAFDFVLVLLSFVYALALAVVLQSAGRLIIERRRVRFSGLLALAMINAVVTVFISWLGMWDYRDAKGMTLYDVTILFVSAVLIYLLCVATAAEPDEAGEFDMDHFFWAQFRFFYGAFTLLMVSYVAGTVIYLRTSQPQLFWQQALADIPAFLIGLTGFLSRNRKVQWAVGLLVLIMSVWWAIAFSDTF